MSKLVLITGGSRGIGYALVNEFVNSGYKVAFTFKNNDKLSNDIAHNLNRRAKAFHLDLNCKDSMIRCLAEIKNYYQQDIDILINNAAIAQEKDFLDISKDDFDSMINANLYAPFFLSQQVIPPMKKKKWGKIINIGSIGGQWGGINQVHYAVAKAGLINLTRSTAKIYSADGIASHCISIGLVETDMTKNELSSLEGQRKAASIPSQRLGTTLEIAKLAVFLSSEHSQYITGQTININGGMYMG